MIRLTLSGWMLWLVGSFVCGLLAGLWCRRPHRRDPEATVVPGADLVSALRRKCREKR
jgi:hypothetical protein